MTPGCGLALPTPKRAEDASKARPWVCHTNKRLRKHEKDLAQDVAEDVLGSAKDGNVKLFIVKVFI